MTQETPTENSTVRIPTALAVGELAEILNISAIDIIKELMKNGVMANVNQVIDFDTAAIVATDLGFELEEETDEINSSESSSKEQLTAQNTSLRILEKENTNSLPRPPVVTVLGHVDHGKTTLLDRIRLTNVVDAEAGGITQHIGAYQTQTNDGRTITFIDTPGHEAFTEMRARGAQITDVAIIVVAADDGLMPQTREAIDHVKAAAVPMVIAINKVDVENADVARTKAQLPEVDLIPEEFGGEQVVVEISALDGTGIEELLESVLLVSDLEEPKANPNKPAIGVILEASNDRHKGPIATVLVQTGTLHQGDAIISGLSSGRIRTMSDYSGNRIENAGPSTPIEITGLNSVPPAGERFEVRDSEKLAKREAIDRQRDFEAGNTGRETVTLDSLFGEIHQGNIENMHIILKVDVHGSLEPLVQTLEDLNEENIAPRVIHASVGSVNESDVQLAVASQGIIIGFNVQIENGAHLLAEQEKVEIREYSIIYDIVQDITQAVQGLLDPIFEEEQDASVEVRQVFRKGRRNAIAGSYVRDGSITRSSKARVLRDGNVVYEGDILSLKRFEDDVREVNTGQECGIQVDGFNEFEEGDEIIIYHLKQIR
ncbi:MAG: translation initiation factor IF-2 [Chloroflexi bacterium]|nr:translation initiation factor IF-2 [Chloroflexota bacterium]|tara:strand:- start:29495 stop:31300 length:1806 start_codon:yes stop_codon:yes gene_type:complete